MIYTVITVLYANIWYILCLWSYTISIMLTVIYVYIYSILRLRPYALIHVIYYAYGHILLKHLFSSDHWISKVEPSLYLDTKCWRSDDNASRKVSNIRLPFQILTLSTTPAKIECHTKIRLLRHYWRCSKNTECWPISALPLSCEINGRLLSFDVWEE